MIRNILIGLLLITTAGLPLQLFAENSTKADGYTLHHNAFTSDTLSPEVTKQYDLVRSKYRGLINISVIKDKAGTTGTPVSAKISAKSTNLMGQIRNIDLKEVIEGDAIYYLGQFPIVNQETLHFTITATPKEHTRPIKATLSQQFFID